MTGRSVEVLTSSLGSYLLGVPLERVEAIADPPPPGENPTAEAVDLAGVWGVAVDDGKSRRAVIIRTAEGPRGVLLGVDARVLRLDTDSVTDLPAFLDGLAEQAGIGGVFDVEGTLGFLIDVEQLLDRTAP